MQDKSMGEEVMPFTQFQKNSTISASEVNDNFYHVAQGDLLPKGALSLSDTTSVYDLGSNVFRYAELHVNNVHVSEVMDKSTYDANSSIWFSNTGYGYEKIYLDYMVTSTTNSIDITGLNSDYDCFYELDMYLINSASHGAYLRVNADTGNYYGSRITYAQDTVYTGTVNYSVSGWLIGHGERRIKANLHLCLPTSGKKFVIGEAMSHNASTTISDIRIITGIYSVTGTVSSLRIVPEFGGASYFYPGSHIVLKGKN